MTDKQMIIDGVGVSECDHYKNSGKCCIPHYQQNIKYTCCNCSRWNCYYKQLKHKEQECERLKYNNDYQVAVLETTIDNLKAELEQEKTLKEMYFTYYKAKHSDIKGEFFNLKTEKEQLSKECEIWKNQVLTTDGEAITVQITQQQFEEYNQLKAENEKLNKELAKVYENIKLSPLCYKCDEEECLRKELEQLKAECEELKREKRNFYNFLTNKYNYGSFRPMWGTYLLRRFFKEDLGDFFDEAAYEMADTIEEKEKQIDKYSQALTEIKEIALGVRNYLDCPSPKDVRYEMDIILQKIRECEVEND